MDMFIVPKHNGGTRYGTTREPTSRHFWLLLLVLVLDLHATHSDGFDFKGQHPVTAEYCNLETFTATCNADEVILMETAKYGRMHLGRCVKGDMGYIGCSKDVLDIADRKCSGRHECTWGIPNEDLELTTPCYQELKNFFEASYNCLPVASVDGKLCRTCDSVKLTGDSGYISSIVTAQSGCGTNSCPWVIESGKGQRINISLYDFTWTRQESTNDISSLNNKARSSQDTRCVKSSDYIFIKEQGRTKPFSVCGGQERFRSIYFSSGNRVEIKLSSSSMLDNTRGQFILYYEVDGCEDLRVGDEMWFRRTEDTQDAHVGCAASDRKWKLSCLDNQWTGGFGNCSHSAKSRPENKSSQVAIGGVSVAYGTAVLIIVLVAAIVGVLILAIGVIAWRWHKTYGRKPRNRRYDARQQQHDVYGMIPKDKVIYDVAPMENLQNCLKHHEICAVETCPHVTWDMTIPPLPENADVNTASDDVYNTRTACMHGSSEGILDTSKQPGDYVCAGMCTFKYANRDHKDCNHDTARGPPRFYDLEPPPNQL